MSDLKTFNHFHDWYIDNFRISYESETLTLDLYLQDRRVSVSFVGTNRFALRGVGLQNIVYRLAILESATPQLEKARQILAKAERWTDRKPVKIAHLDSTCGAELTVEFDSLAIHEAQTGSASGM